MICNNISFSYLAATEAALEGTGLGPRGYGRTHGREGHNEDEIGRNEGDTGGVEGIMRRKLT